MSILFEQTEYLNQFKMQIQFTAVDAIGSCYGSDHGGTRISSLNDCHVLMAVTQFKLTVFFI